MARSQESRQTVSIRLRASPEEKSLIGRAAATLGKSRSAFVLDVSCREAVAVLLDRVGFSIDAERFAAFTAALDRPPTASPRLRRLLARNAPWER